MSERETIVDVEDIVLVEKSEFAIVQRLEQLRAADLETYWHVLRSTDLAVRLAKIVGFDYINLIRRGALLHDIGKLQVMDLIQQNGQFTPQEFEIIKTHPVNGEEDARGLNFQDELPIIRSHHENWDGTGYPDGLHGEGIPFSARIMRVVDAYESLRGKRRFQNSFSKEESKKIMLESERCGFGRAFDPNLLDAFLKLEDSLPIDYFDQCPCQNGLLYVTL